jgi:hypothetical protein
MTRRRTLAGLPPASNSFNVERKRSAPGYLGVAKRTGSWLNQKNAPRLYHLPPASGVPQSAGQSPRTLSTSLTTHLSLPRRTAAWPPCPTDAESAFAIHPIDSMRIIQPLSTEMHFKRSWNMHSVGLVMQQLSKQPVHTVSKLPKKKCTFHRSRKQKATRSSLKKKVSWRR